MKTYTITYSLSYPDFNTVPSLKVCEPVTGGNPDYNIEFRLAWNENQLFVSAVSEEPYIRAMYNGVGSPVWLDSYVGISLKPVLPDPRYITIMSNSNGALYCSIGTSAVNKAQLLLMDEMESFQIKTSRSESSWSVNFVIPLYLVRTAFPEYRFVAGSDLLVNCFKGGERAYLPHFLSWEPRPLDHAAEPHNCSFFGMMHLG